MGWQLIQSQSLSASAASVTFSSIPQTYKSLKVVVSARTDVNNGDGYDGIRFTFNGSASGYSQRLLYGTGSTASSTSSTGGTYANYQYAAQDGVTASTFGSLTMDIPNYAGSASKAFSADSVSENNATASIQALNAGLWANGSAITSITMVPNLGTNFKANSTFTLYGLA